MTSSSRHALTVAVLIPAHNEEDSILDSARSVLAQTRPVSQIVVIADNCSDRTADVVRERAGGAVRVLELAGNRHRKAGALNAGLELLAACDVVVTLDADTILHPDFVANAVELFAREPNLAAVGGRCLPCGPHPFGPIAAASRMQRWLWRAQHHEYAREDSSRIERRGAVDIVPGAAMAIRRRALVEVGGWAVDSLVEDFRLSIQLRCARWRTSVGFGCFCLTHPPLTLRALWRQRRRWYSGVVSEVRRFGAHQACGFGPSQYRLNTIGALGSLASLVLIALALAPIGWAPVPIGVGVVPVLVGGVADRIFRLRYLPHRSWRDIAFALSPAPDLFVLFRQAAWLSSFALPKRASW